MDAWRVHPLLFVGPVDVGGDRIVAASVRPGEPPLVVRDPRVGFAISCLPEEFSRQQALDLWAEVLDDREQTELWDALLDAYVVVDVANPEVTEFDAWCADGWWEAARFHLATRDFPFVSMDDPEEAAADDARMVEYRAASEPPPNDVPLSCDGPGIKLRALDADNPHRSIDSLPPEERRGFEGLGFVLDLCGGVRRTIQFAHQGTFHGKSVPSGGARHPTEMFIASFSIRGLEPGVYRYVADGHSLEPVRIGQTEAAWRHASFDLFLKFSRTPIGAVLFCSRWERAMWRYRDDRSARAPLIDMGHVVMAFRDITMELGLGVYTYQKFRDSEVAELCNLDLMRLTPLYLASLV